MTPLETAFCVRVGDAASVSFGEGLELLLRLGVGGALNDSSGVLGGLEHFGEI